MEGAHCYCSNKARMASSICEHSNSVQKRGSRRSNFATRRRSSRALLVSLLIALGVTATATSATTHDSDHAEHGCGCTALSPNDVIETSRLVHDFVTSTHGRRYLQAKSNSNSNSNSFITSSSGSKISNDSTVSNSTYRSEDVVSAATTTLSVIIPVHIHVILESDDAIDTSALVTEAAVKQLIDEVVNPTYNETMFIFQFSTMDYTTNIEWYHCNRDNGAEMYDTLHVGNANELNLYICNTESTLGLRGWATFPWLLDGYGDTDSSYLLRQDGVTMTYQGVPGADTINWWRQLLTHEVGHWLGLFHTYENGCEYPGDGIADTPAHSGPSFSCASAILDTCNDGDFYPDVDPGFDPVFNIMNNVPSDCRREFTAGQVERMHAMYALYREQQPPPQSSVQGSTEQYAGNLWYSSNVTFPNTAYKPMVLSSFASSVSVKVIDTPDVIVNTNGSSADFRNTSFIQAMDSPQCIELDATCDPAVGFVCCDTVNGQSVSCLEGVCQATAATQQQQQPTKLMSMSSSAVAQRVRGSGKLEPND